MKSINRLALFAAISSLANSHGAKSVFVRIGAKTGPETFFRCGEAFSRAWRRVTVDAATAQRLREEQMLEVTTDAPDDYEPTESELSWYSGYVAQLDKKAAEETVAGVEAMQKAAADAQAAADAKAAADAQAAADAKAAADAPAQKAKK